MPFPLTNLAWQGAGYNLPATLPGQLLTALLSAGVAKNPALGLNSRANEWIALRSWTLTGHVSLEHLTAERVILCAAGVHGSGMLLIDGIAVAPFAGGDWEMDITAQTAGRMTADIALEFNPQWPTGMPPHASIGVDDGLWLRGVSQLRIHDIQATPSVSGGYGTIALGTAVEPYVPGRYTFRYAVVWGDETLCLEEKTENLHAARTTLAHELVLPVPRSWRPDEPNKAVLLRLTVSRAGKVCDDWLLKTGFAEGKPPFLASVDWNGGTEELDLRLQKLRQAHINCLRVTGLQPDALYDALDREGMFFIQRLPEDGAKAQCILRRVRHRPALLSCALDESGASIQSYPGPEALCHQLAGDIGPILSARCPAPPLSPETLAGGEPFWPPATPLWHHRATSPTPLSLQDLEGWLDASLDAPHFAMRLLRFLQAETIRYSVERARFGASGVAVGMPFDTVPSLYSEALFDGRTPRPAYWALESALRPVHGCARLSRMGYPQGATFQAHLGLLCNEATPGPLTVRGRLHLPDGKVLAEAHYDTTPGIKEVGALEAKLPEDPCALLLRVTVERLGQVLDINDYTLCVATPALLSPLARLPQSIVRQDGKGSLINEGNHTVLGVVFGRDGHGVFPGWGALLPGERRGPLPPAALEGLNMEP